MLASLGLLGVFIYIGVMLVLLCMGYRDRLVASSAHQMDFKRPWPERVSTGMLSLLLFLGAGLGATILAADFGFWYTWGWFVPVCFLTGGLMLYASGPQDVCIDLDTRMCYGTRGWMFYPQKRVCPLRETSHLCVFRGGYGCYVVLWINGVKDPMFILAKTSTLSQALSYAERVAIPLQLPVREKTLKEMRNMLISPGTKSY